MALCCPCLRVCRDLRDRRHCRRLIPTENPDDQVYSWADSSLEKVSGGSGEERRSSLPLVGSSDDEGGGGGLMETSTTSATSRLASFFSKRGFRSNLKRTKSVTKLDRKRSGSNASEHDT
ncbi:hypothetical protein ACOMHN_004589 [Nucella lapillus]